MKPHINSVASAAFSTMILAPSLYAKALPPTVQAGKAVASNYPKGDPATIFGAYCQNENLQGNLCVFGASAKTWDTSLSRSGYSMKDTL